jgi:hypothetical protein
MACLLRFGAPPEGDPQQLQAQYQAVFDTH